tara:strand:+ start:395 stop:565 length:171 start_codon:yes stop_codon:yes gene_type:complete
MSKECKTARNMVISAIMILAILIVIMSMSSCGSVKQSGKLKKCCEKTSQAVYEYEG